MALGIVIKGRHGDQTRVVTGFKDAEEAGIWVRAAG
jgi:hypothetical protein